MYKIQQFFNYLTLVLAVITVGLCIYAIIEKQRLYICFTFMIITILVNEISRIYNKQNMNLTKEDEEILKKLKEEKNNRIKK